MSSLDSDETRESHNFQHSAECQSIEVIGLSLVKGRLDKGHPHRYKHTGIYQSPHDMIKDPPLDESPGIYQGDPLMIKHGSLLSIPRAVGQSAAL
jgi:hypothetical protein